MEGQLGDSSLAVGQALAFPALMTIALSGAPASERGAVVGTFTAFFDLAFGLGALPLGAIASLVGYRGSFISAGLVSIAGLGLLRSYARQSRIRSDAPGNSPSRKGLAEPPPCYSGLAPWRP